MPWSFHRNLVAMTTLFLAGLLTLSGTPEKTIQDFVAAFNARNTTAIAAQAEGGKPGSKLIESLPKDARLELTVGRTQINGDYATVEVDIVPLGGFGSPQKVHESVQLHRAGGDWKIVPVDPNGPSMNAKYIGLMAYFVGHPEVMSKAKQAAKATACLSNVKQIALGVLMYSSDHNDMLPKTAAGWKASIMPYMKNERLFHCPEDNSGKVSYFMEPRVAGKSMTSIAAPQATALIVEGTPAKTAFRHNGRASVAFVDGHAKILDPKAVQAARTVRLK